MVNRREQIGAVSKCANTCETALCFLHGIFKFRFIELFDLQPATPSPFGRGGSPKG